MCGNEMRSATADKKQPKVLARMVMTKGAEGGVQINHEYTHYEHKEEPHIFGASEGKEAMAHIAKHMGMKMASEEAPVAEKA